MYACVGTRYAIVQSIKCLTPLSTKFQLYHGYLIFLVEETGVPGENHRHVASHRQPLSHDVASSTSHHDRDSNSQL